MLDSGAGLLLHRGMSEGPNLTRRKAAEHAMRDERLSKALRDNLRRRKEQVRGRGGAAKPEAPGGLSGAALSGTSRRRGGTPAD